MTSETFEYRGYQLVVRPKGQGWEVTIRKGVVENAFRPSTTEQSGKGDVIAQARHTVDGELSRSS